MMRTRSIKIIALVMLAAVMVAACGSSAGNDTQTSLPGTTEDPSVVSGMGPGISIAEAIELGSDGPVLVNGFLFIDPNGNVRLASAMAESFPPQPGGDQLVVEGVHLEAYELSESQGIRWTDEQVQVTGMVDGGTLVVTSTVSG